MTKHSRKWTGHRWSLFVFFVSFYSKKPHQQPIIHHYYQLCPFHQSCDCGVCVYFVITIKLLKKLFFTIRVVFSKLFDWGFASNLCKCSPISWWCNTCTMAVVIHLRWTITMYWSWWQLQTSSSWMVYCASVKLNVLIWWISIT